MDAADFDMSEKQFNDAMANYEKSTFYPSDIMKECPKFRILVIGQTGAGKTTLCGKVFRVDAQHGGTVRNLGEVSAHGRGTQVDQVWKEITFEGQNEDIIMHDSGGFESANETKFEEIQKFIKYRLSQTKLAEQLHCIWYCIPLTGHRQIQTSEEKFFKEVYVGDIPVIAVFTHFDTIEDAHEFTLIKTNQRLNPNKPLPPDLPKLAHALAVRDYDEIYRPSLENLTGRRSKVAFRRVSMPPNNPDGDNGINELVITTFDMLTKDGSLRRLWTATQQQSAALKRQESIDIAMTYLSTVTISNSIPFIPFLGGGMFGSSFNQILSLVSTSWGLLDPRQELQKPSTRRRFFEACLRLSTAGRIGVRAGMALNFLGPVTAPFITVALLKTAAGLIMIHEDLFWKQREEHGFQLTTEGIQQVAVEFSESRGRGVAAAHIDSKVDLLNYAAKEHCKNVLTTAIRLARGEEDWQQQQQHRDMSQDR